MLAAIILGLVASFILAPLVGSFCAFNDSEPADHLGGDDPDGRGGVAAGRGFHGASNSSGGQP